jgi:ribonuclease HII
VAVLAGIDEAGYGPLLGPLVVSSCSFQMPDELLAGDLWDVLKKSVSSSRKHLSGRLLVVDSKKAYSKTLGIGHLERTVRAVLSSAGKEPGNISELLNVLCPNRPESLTDYPWYQDAGGHCLCGDAIDRAIASSVFKDDLADNSMKLLDIQSCCLDVAYYNKMVKAVKNKASVLFTAITELVKKAYENCDDELIQIIVDRQGGRMHYRTNLQMMFPEMELRILKENQNLSSYELKSQRRTMRVHFAVGGDQRYLPVSLASMVSKYLRELLIGCMNRYFTSFCADLKPTAGYWEDGLRFVEELRKNLPHIQFDSEQLIRSR